MRGMLSPSFYLFCFLSGLVPQSCELEDIEIIGEVDNPAESLAHTGYYVAPDGDDGGSGSFADPWATWQHAINQALPGDTIFFREGVYRPQGDRNAWNIFRKSGTKDKPICLFNYPGERPVLDCSGKNAGSPSVGVNIVGSKHIVLRGLEFTGTLQSSAGETTVGCYLLNSSQILLQEVKSYGHDGSGFYIEFCDTVTFLNCDAFDNYDLHSTRPGCDGDGFSLANNTDGHGMILLKGCRAWNNSDDGFDTYNNNALVVFDSCWAFLNGRDRGDGSGFKFGKTSYLEDESPRRIVRFCLAADNKFIGFNENHSLVRMHFFNNTAVGNLVGFGNFRVDGRKGEAKYRNNLAYNNLEGTTRFYSDISEEHNSWSDSIEVNDEDFLSLNVFLLEQPRLSNGDLPDVDYMNLREDSELIDAGVDVGLFYLGNAPDIGAFEKQ